jgi:hypothetical protein
MNAKQVLERVPPTAKRKSVHGRVVHAAYAEREHVHRSPRRRLMLAAVVVAVAAAAAALSPGPSSRRAVRRTIGISHAAPALFGCPRPAACS